MSIYIFGLPIGILIILWGLYGGVQAVKKLPKQKWKMDLLVLFLRFFSHPQV